jgi:hypothetical protein
MLLAAIQPRSTDAELTTPAWQNCSVRTDHEESRMSKRARKRRDRKKSSANHGKRPHS